MGAKSTLLSSGASFLGGAGKSLLTGLGLGAKGGAIGTLNPATGAFVPGSGALTSLLTNPFTIGAGAAAIGVSLWLKGQAHRKANDWTQHVQTAWGDSAIDFMKKLDASHKAGTLSYEDALKASDELEGNVSDLWDKGALFSSKGGDHKRVIDQAHQQLDPTIEGWRKTLKSYVDALAPAPAEKVSDTPAPSLGPEAEVKARGAAEQQRKRALGMKGRQSTILTGSMRLKGTTAGQPRTLLGY